MKVLILGASGQLGREWQVFLTQSAGKNMVVIPYTSSQWDITDFTEVAHEFNKQQPDLIINCAAYTKVDQAEDEREKARLVNVEAVQNLARLCKNQDCKLVHFSTDYIFAGKKEDQHQFPQGYPEDHQAAPVNWYGQTKWEGEEVIRASGCRHLVMRVSWLCGAYGTNFVTTMLRLAEEHAQLSVVDNQFGSPTFTDNLVKNMLKLIEDEQQGTYHLSSEGIISWADFAEAIFKLSGKDVQVKRIPSKEYPTKALRPFFSKLDTQKIKKIPGIKTEHWQTGLKRLLKQIHPS